MGRVYLSRGQGHGLRPEVGGEPERLWVAPPVAGHYGCFYYRTRQHSKDGLRVYVAVGTGWPPGRSLGWQGPDGFTLETDFRDGLWWFRLSAKGHAVSFRGLPTKVADGEHFVVLDLTACRIARADHQLARRR